MKRKVDIEEKHWRQEGKEIVSGQRLEKISESILEREKKGKQF